MMNFVERYIWRVMKKCGAVDEATFNDLKAHLKGIESMAKFSQNFIPELAIRISDLKKEIEEIKSAHKGQFVSTEPKDSVRKK